jgi:Fe-S cluster assembly protein SufD
MREVLEKIVLGSQGRKEVNLRLERKGETKEFVVVVFGRKKGVYKVKIDMCHLASETKSKVVVRVISRGGAEIEVWGIIRVGRKRRWIESRLEMRGLLFSNGGKIEFRPNLEIEASEVKVSHGAVISRIDDEQLMYLRSRGFSVGMAEKLLIKGFLNSIA